MFGREDDVHGPERLSPVLASSIRETKNMQLARTTRFMRFSRVLIHAFRFSTISIPKITETLRPSAFGAARAVRVNREL
jgi:hypothetical protein